MGKAGYCLCCVGEDDAEDLFWFSHERRVTEAVAREKFQHHAAMIPPEIGLRLYATGMPWEARRLLAEKMPMRQPPAQASQTV
mgnify:CR=1 FL=1